MVVKLLVVHPEQEYDRHMKARNSIRELCREFSPENIYVAYNRQREAQKYLGLTRNDLWIPSSSGEISDPDAGRIMDGCSELTIIGHNFKDCHYDAFEAVAKQARGDVDIVMPTYTSTEGTFFRLESDEVKRIGESFDSRNGAIKVSYKFGKPYPYLSTEEIVSLKEAERYVAFLTRRDYSVDVYADGRKVFDRQGDGHKVVLLIRNAPPIDFR